MAPFPGQRATKLFSLLRGAAERLGCCPIGSLVAGPVVATLPQRGVVSMGRRNTQLRPTFNENKS
jgi:hypothetical protein